MDFLEKNKHMQYNDSLMHYISDHSDSEDAVLQNITRRTYLEEVYPRMLSGHLQGVVLKLLSKMIRPASILEIGTFTGYSAICLAKGLRKGGRLHTIEQNDELQHKIAENFCEAGVEEQIQLHIGDAKTIIPALNIQFDLVFIDADKSEYPNYYKLVKPKLEAGGVMIADNVLWGGKVVDDTDNKDKESLGIQQFNQMVKHDPQMEKVILPLRDGLFMIRKKD